jgi:hypothetical protein
MFKIESLRTEDWKEIRPVTAGMFARGAYPTEKA